VQRLTSSVIADAAAVGRRMLPVVCDGQSNRIITTAARQTGGAMEQQ